MARYNQGKPKNNKANKGSSESGQNKKSLYERVYIQGKWEVMSPMHVGSGFVDKPDNEDSAAEIALVCKDNSGNPYIPASTLRGLIRATVNTVNDSKQKAALLDILGDAKPDSETEQSDREANNDQPKNYHSRLRIYDAQWNNQAHYSRRFNSHVVIAPITRTAEQGKLFSLEQVMTGTLFSCNIELDRVDEDEIALVLGILQVLANNALQNRIGKGANKLQGQLQWQTVSVKALKRNDFVSWLNNPKETDLTSAKIKDADIEPEKLSIAIQGKEFEIYIRPLSPLLVPDTNIPTEKGKPDKCGLTEKRGGLPKLIIPGSSILGAFRAQCRKILMTMAFRLIEQPTAPRSLQELQQQCARAAETLIQRFFGHQKQGSLIWIGEAVSLDELQPHNQFFNAIDRFTGGGADGALFNFKSFTSQALSFRMRIADSLPESAIALITFALRDATEGDITLGAGAAHGYGRNLMGLTKEQTGNWEHALNQISSIFGKQDLARAIEQLEDELQIEMTPITAAE